MIATATLNKIKNQTIRDIDIDIIKKSNQIANDLDSSIVFSSAHRVFTYGFLAIKRINVTYTTETKTFTLPTKLLFSKTNPEFHCSVDVMVSLGWIN
jgi:hypothetical protein